ncbi:MAG TPA: thiol:disulfide interchange protein DsbA/DsbL [Burkholderiaceae bacterium]|jgi:thiol:disulfide interchange protein DsbA
MRIHQKVLAVLSFCLVACTAGATPANPQNGTDYRTLPQAQPTESGKKVEVTEFFWYSCPHCNAFEPDLEAWVKKQGDKINFKRVPVIFRPEMIPEQHLYYALEAMGKSEEMQPKIFHAIHVEHKRLDNPDAIADFVAKQGIDKQKFMALYNSFGVETKVKRAAQLQEAYKIDGVPTVAIDGRYLTSPGIVGVGMGNQPEPVLHKAALQVMDWLVANAKKK